MTIYLLEIKTSLVIFSALKYFFYDFVFYLRSVGCTVSHELIFENGQNGKKLNIKSQLNHQFINTEKITML